MKLTQEECFECWVKAQQEVFGDRGYMYNISDNEMWKTMSESDDQIAFAASWIYTPLANKFSSIVRRKLQDKYFNNDFMEYLK